MNEQHAVYLSALAFLWSVARSFKEAVISKPLALWRKSAPLLAEDSPYTTIVGHQVWRLPVCHAIDSSDGSTSEGRMVPTIDGSR